MAQQSYPCENCKFRASYDKNPKSLKGRFWRWHINFCPGLKASSPIRTKRRRPPFGRNTTSKSTSNGNP